MFFKLNWGTHRVAQGNGNGLKLFHAGDVIETDRELDKLFPLKLNAEWKFSLVAESTPAQPAIPVMRSPSKTVRATSEQVALTDTLEDDIQSTSNTAATAVLEKSSKYGDDVTADFEAAKGLRFKVYFDGQDYKVVDAIAKKVLNKTLKIDTPKGVRRFLKKYQVE